MVADETGMMDTLRYWCQGSEEKALQLVMAQIKELGLRDRVVDALGLKQNEDHLCVIGRLKAAISSLKQCRNEQQRQEYRLLLAAIAPEKGERMNDRVANAVGARRGGAPFLDAIDRRVIIDQAIALQNVPIGVGDRVMCRHGEGLLVEYSGLNSPCAVEITIEGYVHISKFTSAGKAKGGGRLQRVPVSFACEARMTRCDALHADLKEKVRALTAALSLLHSHCCTLTVVLSLLRSQCCALIAVVL